MSRQSLGRCVRFLAYLAILGCTADRASAVVLFSDNFNTNTSAAWTINAAPAADAANQQATFAFDYNAFGIPAAPGSSDTLGLQLKANIPGGAANPNTNRPVQTLSGLSVSPTDKNFGTNYEMSFYAWSNFFGSPNAQGLADNALSEGGTNNVMFAIGTSGTVPVVVGNTALAAGASMDGIGFATTGDGGIGQDYRAYPQSATTSAPTSGVYAANSRESSNAFYTAMFPALPAPEVQQTISANEYGGDAFNTQLGLTQPGAFGFAWHKVVITKNNNSVTWKINDTLIATVDASTLNLTSANIALGVSDVNTSTARHPSLVFTVFDNLVVTDLPPAGLPGDFNGDQFVDGNDFLIWQRGGSPNPTSAGDLADWKANFGMGASLVGAVPEPGTVLLAWLGAPLMGLGARRQRPAA